MPGRFIERAWQVCGWASVVLLLLTLVASVSCTKSPQAQRRAGPVRIVVSIPPLLGPVKEIAGAFTTNATVDLMVPVGTMEHGYEIPPSMVAKIMEADVIVYVGLGLEPQIEQMLAKKKPWQHAVCMATLAGIENDSHDDHDHDHGHNHAHDDHDHAHDDHDHDHHGHDHSGADPHLWLNPKMMLTLVDGIEAALAKVASERGLDSARADLAARAALQKATIQEVDSQYAQRLSPFTGRTIVTAHAAWGRLADRYSLVQAPLAGLEAAEPSPGAIAQAAQMIKDKRVGALFSEPQISPVTVRRLADMAGVQVYQLDPLGNGDWVAMMTANLDALVKGLSSPQ